MLTIKILWAFFDTECEERKLESIINSAENEDEENTDGFIKNFKKLREFANLLRRMNGYLMNTIELSRKKTRRSLTENAPMSQQILYFGRCGPTVRCWRYLLFVLRISSTPASDSLSGTRRS